MSIEKLKKLFFHYEDVFLEKRVLAELLPKEACGITLSPKYKIGEDGDIDWITVTINIECTDLSDKDFARIDEDAREDIEDAAYAYLFNETSLREEIDNIEEDAERDVCFEVTFQSV